MSNLRALSPSQRARIDLYFAGPMEGEDRNAFLSRINQVLTPDDSDWILEFLDHVYDSAEVHGPFQMVVDKNGHRNFVPPSSVLKKAYMGCADV